MSISRLMQMAAAGAGGEYQISRSLRFNSADSAYLSRTPASASNRKTFTVSCWAKRTTLGAAQYLWEGGSPDGVPTRLFCRFEADDTLRVATGGSIVLNTTQVFRDVSSWYHIVVAIDTPNATLANRAKLYVNGVEVTAFSSASYFGLSDDTGWNMAQAHSIGRTHIDAGNYFNGYITEFYNIDGQALTPSSFGEFNATTGVWSPIRYAGSYGTNGFYLNFSDNSDVTAATLGADYSGNGNNWTPSGFSVTAGAGNDSLVDVPTRNTEDVDTGAGGEVRGNYATLNPLKQTGATLTNGNLQFTKAAGSGATLFTIHSTLFVSTGKWYFEVPTTSVSAGGYHVIGVVGPEVALATYSTIASMTGNIWAYRNDANKINNGSSASYGNTWTSNDVIGVAIDLDNSKIWFSKNGTWQASGDPSAGTNAAYTNLTGSVAPLLIDQGGDNFEGSLNAGQRPFAYTAPSGFKALVTTNLPQPTVVQGDDYFNTVLFTGNYPTGQSITGVGFAPDLTWFKSRSVGDSHNLVDKVRGAFRLKSNTTDAETSATVTLDSDGFTVGAQSESNNDSMVAWNWKANGAGVSNTDGTITSTVSANTDSGFSVVTYTGNGVAGATRGHGLGVAPNMIIIKGRSNVDNWHVYHSSLGNTGGLFLNLTSAFTVSSFFWNDTSPSSTVFTTSLGASNNQNGITYVAYCFAAIQGYSAFGSYTGNGSADGPFVYTGFRPAFVLGKDSSSTNNWFIFDSVRDTYNVAGKILRPNLSDAELDSPPRIDLLSNGFKVRSTALPNDSGETYIYAAFASNPFKFALAR
jgi:hypothetical protein